MTIRLVLLSTVAAIAIATLSGALVTQAQPVAPAIDTDDIGGVVLGPNGPKRESG